MIQGLKQSEIAALPALRVLLVEDEALLAMTIEDDLRSWGCSVVGPCGKFGDALQAARQNAIDLAILDINLNGQSAFPIADCLISRGIPFLFLTGYASTVVERFKASPLLSKPYEPAVLRKEIATVLHLE